MAEDHALIREAVRPSAADASWSLPAARGRFAAGWARLLVVIVTLAGTAILASWPLATRITDAVPLASEHEATVPLANIWALWWTADRLGHGLADFWNAPIFRPSPGTFTFSEPAPLVGLIVSPLWMLGAPPALILNLALVVVLVLNGLFAYRLLRALDQPPQVATLGGMLVTALPIMAKLMAVLNVLSIFGLLWALEGLVRFGRSGAAKHAFWAALGLIAAFFSCQQNLLMFSPFVLGAGWVALSQRGYARSDVAKLLVAGLAALAVVLPVALPVMTLHEAMGLSRSEFEVQALSARLGDFLTRPATSWLHVPPVSPDDTGGLFPGILVLGLAVAALAWQRKANSGNVWTRFMAWSAALAVVLALGLNFDILGFSLFRDLRILPGFGELRSVYRFAFITQAMLALLAAFGLAEVLRRGGGRGAALAITLGSLALVENLSWPMPLTPVPTSPRTAWTSWLAGQPENTVIAHIPFAAGLTVKDYELDGWRMLSQTVHHQPMLNGYSSYFPPGYGDFQAEMKDAFPTTDLLCRLHVGLGASLLVVDQSWMATKGTALEATGLVSRAYADDRVTIFRVSPPPGACPITERSP